MFGKIWVLIQKNLATASNKIWRGRISAASRITEAPPCGGVGGLMQH